MSKVSTTSGKTPTPLPTQSAWAKGPPQSSSSAAPSPRSQSPAPTHVASPIATSHSRRPSALGQGVSVKDGVSVPRNNVGSVVRPASVVFGSIDDAPAPLSSSPAAIPAVKTEVVKSFGSVPATSSNHVNGKTSASASATGSSKQPSRPSLSSTPSNSSTPSSTAATSTASTPKPSRADIAKLFQNPSSSSSQPSSDTSSPSTRPSNLPPHHQPSSSSSQQPQQPSQLGTHSYSQFVPSNMRQPQQPSGTPRSPAFPRAVQNVQGQSRQGAGPGGPGGPPIPASPRMASHPHQAPPGGMGQQVPMQPMQWSGYYYMDPYNQPQPPWGYYAMPSQHMHQPPHPQHVPHAAPPHQPGPLPMSPRPAAPQLPGTPTMAHAIPHPPHTPQPPPTISSPPPTPSTANAPRLNTNARDFVPGGRPAKVTIKSQDGMEVTLDALKKHSPQPPTVPIPPASPIVANRRHHSVSVRIESEETKRAREENARKEQEKKDAEERAKKEAVEKKKREEEEETGYAWRRKKRSGYEKQRRRRTSAYARRKKIRLEAERQEAEQARIALEEEARKQQDALEAEEAQLEADEADDVVQTPSPASESQEPEDGEVSEHDEAPEPQLNGDGGKKLKESLRIDTFPEDVLVPLDLASAKRDVSAPPPSALLTARVIENLSEVAYPEGIKSPKVELNANVRDGRFRYDRDFLMQFMHICKEKPPTLPALDLRLPCPAAAPDVIATHPGAMPVSANRQASVGLGIGGFQKPSVPSGFQMGNFQSPGSKLTSEERFAMSNPRSASTSSATSQFRSPMVRTPSTGGPGHPMHGSNRTRSKRGEKRGDANKAPMSHQGQGSGFGVAPILGAGFEPVVPLELSANRWVPASTARKVQPDVDSPELVDRKVKALLNKLTMEKFETISDQIIHWANMSVNEKDGRTLIQVIRLVFEKATDEAAWSEMYARLCRKMMEQINPEVQDDGIKNSDGKPIAGGQLFRKYLLNRCQEDFERGWFAKEATAAAAAAKASDDHATKAANDKKGTEEAELYSEEYYAAQKAKRQGLGLIKFIGELFKLQMLTERIMHECVKKLLGNVENPEEEEIESLCQLLKTVGQLLDTPKARAHMDVYFTRMKELGKSLNVSSRMQFMLQDVIELRDRKWVSRNAVAAPTTIAAAAKEKAAAEKESFNRQISMSRGGSRRGGDRNQEHGPDGWAVAGGNSVPRAPPKAGDLSQFGKITKGPQMAMVMGPSGVFAGKKDSKREALSRTNSSSNMFHMLSQNPELAAEGVLPSPVVRQVGKRALILVMPGVPEPAVQRRKLQLLPRSAPATEENATTPSEEEPESAPESAPTAMSEAEFFAVRNLEEADVYFTNLPDEHRFRLVDKLVASALESKEMDARLVGDFFAQATSNGQCTLEVFEEGFMPMAEFLDDIAIDAPKAFDYMAIMLRGAGFEKEPERLQRIASKLEDSDKLVSLVA
ncbi:hypothetical protein EDB19DRAFT_1921210 [Suillus lakei]|nr:hypothetical protein EDB19DRAFT_1921210 [Suillus lakei]